LTTEQVQRLAFDNRASTRCRVWQRTYRNAFA